MVLLPFFASYSGLGFWNVLAVKIKSQNKLKTSLSNYFCPMAKRKMPRLVVTAEKRGIQAFDLGALGNLGILDSGFWILDRYVGVLFVKSPRWILDLGFLILDFGALCSNSFCGDFGFWISDFGYMFWALHKIRILVTPTRVGGLHLA